MTSKIKFSEIIGRIKIIADLKSDSDVAKTLKLSKAALSERKARESIPYEEVLRFAEQRSVPIEWLLTGEGLDWREFLKPEASIAEHGETFLISVKGEVAQHNKEIIKKMMRQLVDIVDEGDYRKTGALQSLLDVLAPRKEEEK